MSTPCRISYLLVALLVLCCCGAGLSTKRALIIGVDAYLHQPALSGSVNDATIMSDLLRGWYGFEDKDTIRLVDAQATCAAIKSAMNTLVAVTCPNDVVVLHLSGHGATVKIGDEYHDAYVPYDGVVSRPETMLTSADLRAWYARLHTPFIYVILDHCYAAGMGRALPGPHDPGVKVSVGERRYIGGDTENATPVKEPVTRGGVCMIYASNSRVAVHDLTITLSNGSVIKAGGLTYALYRSLYENPYLSPSATVQSTVDRLRSWGVPQQPGERGLMRGPIFGGPRKGVGPCCLPIVRQTNGRFELIGGSALSLANGTRVECVDDQGNKSFDRTITQVELWRAWVR